MKKYIIGIDTGGTFTDGVLFDGERKKVLVSIKEETTHSSLSIGIGRVLENLIDESGILPEQIQQVNLSSTLATNSVVEKRGARVGLIVIGYVKHFKLPVQAVVFVKGGHNIKGEEEQPLEIEYLVDIVNGLKNEVDAFGVCGAMSMKNSDHEKVAEKAISMIAAKPVFCSHTISQQAGMEQRAATAGLHAKLMPVMEEFVAGVSHAMEGKGLHCPMFIISGNGKLVEKQYAVEHAGVTVASGPFCTANFGAFSACENALVVDIGGTTTDISMLQDKKPVIAEEGSVIGDWKTHVEAVDMLTGAIGGDSLVTVYKNGKIELGPRRVVPLAKDVTGKQISKWLGVEDKNKIITLVTENEVDSDGVAKALQEYGPLTPSQLREYTQLSGIPLEKKLEDLSRKQQVVETGFTPTDAFHVLGQLSFGDITKAEKGAAIYAELTGQSVEEFCRTVIRLASEKIENLIIDYIVQKYWGKSLSSFLAERGSHPVLGVDFSVKIPIIGVGAAAKVFLPPIAEKLQTEVKFPLYCDVGNAVGAALVE